MTHNKFYSYYGYFHYITGVLITWEQAKIIEGLKRLAKKHHRLAEMDCNGEGVIRGVHYYAGAIDDYARRAYGAGVKSAYIKDDVSIFDIESDKIQDKIINLVHALGDKFEAQFQGDPRGATVRLYFSTKDVTELFYL